MVRTSVTHLILFIAVVGVATVFVGMLTVEVGLFAQSVDREGDRDATAIDTELTFVNDPEAGTTYDQDSDTVTLYVKNTGGGTLEPTELDVLLDGEYASPASTTVLGEEDDWRVGSVLEVTLDSALETGDHRVVVRINSAQAVLEFDHREAFWLDPSGEPGTSDCDATSCTVDANQTDELTLTMGTDRDQEGESVSYAVNDTTVASVDPTAGTTDVNGEDETTLELVRNGTVSVSLDAGWDDDEIHITVVNATGQFFEVSEFDAPDSTAANETITVNATVENIGDMNDTQTVEYRFDGVVENSTDVTLEPGESTVVEFTYTVDAESGTYTHGVYSEDNSETETITVESES